MTAGRTIAFGDVHGCSAALGALLQAIESTPLDTLAFLGDYIDRGPDSRGVLEQVIAVPHCSGKVASVGHTPQKSGEVLDLGFIKCIDTFCHGGGWLTTLEVHTGKVWQANLAGELRR